MLAEAYGKAEDGDFSVVRQLQELFSMPYVEQPGVHEKYYSKTPENYRQKGGISYYS